MKSSTRRSLLIAAAIVVGAPLFLFAVSGRAREEARSLWACFTLARSGFRPVAEEPPDRFLGIVQPFTARCRGGDRAVELQGTPWVDWANYWATGDASTRSGFGLVPVGRLSRNQRGIDGALLDLEYQRIELLKFNLFDNYTFEEYVRGRDGVPGRSLKVWDSMRLPPEHPRYEDVGGDGEQLCTGELIRHRTLTGICNDIRNPRMGSTNTAFARNVEFEETFPRLGANELVRNRHGDRIGLFRPDPQVVSRKLFTRSQSEPERCRNGTAAGPDARCDYVKAPFFNVLAAFWIQFMTHDWFSHLDEGRNAPEMMAVGCGAGGAQEAAPDLSAREAEELGCRPGDRIDRSLYDQTGAPPTFESGGESRLSRAHRTTVNTNTAWWDASQLYGYSERSQRRVKRDPSDPAKLLMVPLDGRDAPGDAQGYLPLFGAGDPIHPSWSGQEAAAFPDNWSVGLSFLHNLFAREHNLFVDEFRRRAAADPDADSGLRDPAEPDEVIRYADVTDEELFQVARLVVAAEIAKIHTIEWTTQLLYDEPLYEAMNSNWFGLFRENDLLSRALERVVVDRLGRSFDEADQTQWYSVFASGSGIFGLGSRRYEGRPGFLGRADQEDIWDLTNPDHVNGGINHFGSPFNFPEEFITVYRLHPLVPDLLELREWQEPDPIRRAVPVVSTFRSRATPAMRDEGLADWAVTMGRQRLGALTLRNHPLFLQNLPMPRLAARGSETGRLDVVALDVLRDRERGIPRFNEFRRQYGLKTLTSFDDFTDTRLPEDSPARRRQEELAEALREVYGQHACDDSKVISEVQHLNGRPITDCLGHPDGTVVDNVEDVDAVVGWLAESRRPHGFAISETQFTVFIINASRRLFSDRFFTSSFRPEFYGHLGVEWVTNNGPDGVVMEEGEPNGHEQEVSPMKRVLLRAIPELEEELDGVVNAFDPWARDRGEFYSLEWTPRPGAEDDPAFAPPPR
ncbi:MAG: oxygenase [Gemmatimonadetes bacterium]|nr:oxygenase [Gemmatimonadota bacterium]NIR77346.1 oxygenase [Gemmatimonadota bacterium]NIT85872.1 oxygenase [Gemmatimonadota bacterium]NIU29694.1 oxygenase [Gemmatimonadota bacterium]NIV60103.1 oxygenase [Gemmatimonadota bacterium]